MGVKLWKSGVIQVGYKAFKVDAKGTDKYRLLQIYYKVEECPQYKVRYLLEHLVGIKSQQNLGL